MKPQRYRNLTPQHIKQQGLLATIILDLSPHSQDIYQSSDKPIDWLQLQYKLSKKLNTQQPTTSHLPRHPLYILLSFLYTRHIQTIDNKVNPPADLQDNECSFPPKANNGTGNWDIKDCTSVSVRQTTKPKSTLNQK